MNGVDVLHVQKVAGISGSEAHLLSLLPQLRERGIDARFLMLHEDEPGAWQFADALTGAGVPLDSIRIAGDIDPIVLGRLIRYLAGRRPTVLHTHLVHADVYGLLAGSAARIPVLASTKHGFNEFRERRGFGLADRTVARLADLHIAISHGLAEYLEETEGFDADSFRVVHYGIDASSPEAGPATDPDHMICVGRLIPIKGHIVLFRALAIARRERPGLRVTLAGRGPLEPALRAIAREYGIADMVHFAGQVSPVQPAMESASVVLVPSLGEGFGMVALEAMERSRPVIAAAIGGLAEVVEDGVTGLLVPPSQPEPLAEAIVGLARDPARAAAMGAAGRLRAVERFTLQECTRRTVALYEEALGSASR